MRERVWGSVLGCGVIGLVAAVLACGMGSGGETSAVAAPSRAPAAAAPTKVRPPAQTPSATPAGSSDVAVTIAVPVHNRQRSLTELDHFHVLVRNVSASPLRLWTERYSWGYANLGFEQVHDDGRVTRISRSELTWDKNIPDWLELQPGEAYVLGVDLRSTKVWSNALVAGGTGGPTEVKLRAVYEVKPDPESAKLGVWTGRVVSPLDTYVFW